METRNILRITRDEEGAEDFLIVFWRKDQEVVKVPVHGHNHYISPRFSPVAQMHVGVFEQIFGFVPDYGFNSLVSFNTGY